MLARLLATTPAVRVLYRRLKAKRKPEKLVRIAVARKLLLIAHAM